MTRGQAALEFLMTYGWAILVVLAAIGALSYFGVLSPDRFLPEKCFLPPGLGCIDFTGDRNGITLLIQNSLGRDIDLVTIAINGTGCVMSSQSSGPSELKNGAQGRYDFNCTPVSGKWQGVIDISYTNQGALSQRKRGELILAVP